MKALGRFALIVLLMGLLALPMAGQGLLVLWLLGVR